jgi:DeoR/GlpR family transcriptional regulator of sugar metabolism
VGPNENCIFLGQTQQQTTPNLKSNQQKEKWKQILVNSKDKIILRLMTKHEKKATYKICTYEEVITLLQLWRKVTFSLILTELANSKIG